MMDIIILRVPARDVYKREKPRPNDPEQSADVFERQKGVRVHRVHSHYKIYFVRIKFKLRV